MMSSVDYARRVAELYYGLNSGMIAFEPGAGETRGGNITIAEALRAMATGNG